MNEHGKSIRDGFVFGFILLAVAEVYFLHPEILVNDKGYIIEFMKSLEFAQYLSLFMFCGAFLYTAYALSYVIGSIAVYAVYFVQRFWYLHKLRKPERVYTGDSL